MLRRIDTIKKFGIFSDFNWQAQFGKNFDFKERNLIYGWNYSGKTTLSRLIASIGRPEIAGKYQNTEFEYTFESEPKKSSKNLGQENRSNDVIVFNQDFKKEYFFWEIDETKGIEPIKFVMLERASEKMKQKVQLEKEIVELEGEVEQLNNDIKARKVEREKRFTKEATRFSELVYGTSHKINKSHIKKTLESNKEAEEYETFIASERPYKDELIKKCKAKLLDVPKSLLERDLIAETKAITVKTLKETVTSSVVDAILDNDKDVREWVEKGIVLNEKKENCLFCGQTLTKKRLEDLFSYFSSTGSRFRKEIIEKQSAINIKKNEALNNLKEIDLRDFYEYLSNDVEVLNQRLKKVKKGTEEHFKRLNDALEDKKDLCDKVLNYSYPDLEENLYVDWISQYNVLCENHNDYTKKLGPNIKEAQDRLSKLLIYELIVDDGEIQKSIDEQNAQMALNQKKEDLDTKKLERAGLISQINSAAKGEEELNQFLKLFLYGNNIKIELVETDDVGQFVLKRDGHAATNLSEGEKTAITFSYFLVLLKSFGDIGLKEKIVFIDDPISSLDEGHLAQLVSVIDDTLIGINAGDLKCKQIFLSTHNFKFLNLVKKTKLFKCETSKYYVNRYNKKSSIQKMPYCIAERYSEYLLVFSRIASHFNLLYHKNEIANKVSKGSEVNFNDNSVMMPNLVRRFLELFTRIKLPGDKGDLEERLEKIGTLNKAKPISKAIVEIKKLHSDSHLNEEDGVLFLNPNIQQTRELLEKFFFLIDLIDSEHLNSLIGGLDVKFEGETDKALQIQFQRKISALRKRWEVNT